MAATMSTRSLESLAFVVSIAVASIGAGPAGARAQAPAETSGATYTAPLTPWGDPDLQGFYTNKDENGIPLERPGEYDEQSLAEVEDSEFADVVRERNERARERASLIGGAETGAGPVHWYEHYDAQNSRPWLLVDPPDGRVPALVAGASPQAGFGGARRPGYGPADSYEDRSNYDRCITRGLPGSMMPAIYGNAYQIVQGPGFAAIRYEMIHETRIIPLDGSPHLHPSIRPYMGDARGRWEGQTLAVETTNFNDRSAYRGSRADALRIVERFTPTAPDTVLWAVTIEDPTTWTAPWTFAMNLTRDGTQQVFEYACHEGNRGLENILSGARADERRAAESGPRP